MLTSSTCATASHQKRSLIGKRSLTGNWVMPIKSHSLTKLPESSKNSKLRQIEFVSLCHKTPRLCLMMRLLWTRILCLIKLFSAKIQRKILRGYAVNGMQSIPLNMSMGGPEGLSVSSRLFFPPFAKISCLIFDHRPESGWHRCD